MLHTFIEERITSHHHALKANKLSATRQRGCWFWAVRMVPQSMFMSNPTAFRARSSETVVSSQLVGFNFVVCYRSSPPPSFPYFPFLDPFNECAFVEYSSLPRCYPLDASSLNIVLPNRSSAQVVVIPTRQAHQKRTTKTKHE
jgi:hypothetical protein